MGRRGPKPTPTALLKLRGSRLAAEREANEPKVGRGRPAMPTWLMPAAKAIWRHVSAELEQMGLLTTADGDALARYCQTLARWVRAQRIIARRGETFATKTTAGHPTIKLRPEVGLVKGLAVELAKLEASFGLTPSARASLAVTAIYTPGRMVSDPTPSAPVANPDPKAPNVIDGKSRFFR